jgi:hypothetical protein
MNTLSDRPRVKGLVMGTAMLGVAAFAGAGGVSAEAGLTVPLPTPAAAKEAMATIPDTLDLLSQLVDKSLVSLTPDGRYHLHELLRQFSADKLTAVPLEQGLKLEAELASMLGQTEDQQEGARAFAEKRPAHYKRA